MSYIIYEMKDVYTILIVFLVSSVCFARVSDKHSISAISKTVAQQASGTMSENLDQDDDLNWKRRHKRRKKIRRKKRGM